LRPLPLGTGALSKLYDETVTLGDGPGVVGVLAVGLVDGDDSSLVMR